MEKRLTVDTDLTFCDIAQCSSTPGGSFCKDGYCDQRRVYERLREYERNGSVDQLRALKEAEQKRREGCEYTVTDSVGSVVCEFMPDTPTVDAVQVVRCGECKNFSPRASVNFCGRTGATCQKTDYCSSGEPRTPPAE